MTIDSTGTTAVDNNYFWLPIATCPKGVKVQLIARKTGVAQYGKLEKGDTYYTHWAPLPKFKKDEK